MPVQLHRARSPAASERALKTSAAPVPPAATELELAALASRFVAPADLSASERALLRTAKCGATNLVEPNVDAVALSIAAGEDPLGDALGEIRTTQDRRRRGAVYTPVRIVQAMVGWATTRPTPVRIVDPGAGSGRFLLAAGREFAQSPTGGR